ncbi:hypothetical protein CIE30_004354 [Salmonella enterica subsp. enterica serovar Kiambu]|nr:hypothetical protein [Salmonella enterica subsp. enterica serovar Kiambu]
MDLSLRSPESLSAASFDTTMVKPCEIEKIAQNAIQRVLRRCRKEPYLTCSDVFLNISTFKSAFKDAIMPMRQAEGL